MFNMACFFKLGNHRLDTVNRNGKAKPRTAGVDRCVHSHNITLSVNKWATRIARINDGVHLDQAELINVIQGTAYVRHNTVVEGVSMTKGISQGRNPLSPLQ